jgi:cation diffusion facilitator family transporter
VVVAALAGNLLVAVSKFIAALVSGSSAMLTEAIHSTSDCANQFLLLIGSRRAKRPPDDRHPFGYGMEIYFWTFVVAVLVLLAGGVYSLYQGYRELTDPQVIRTPILNLIVLALSAAFEGSTFSIGYRQYRRIAASHVIPGQNVGLFRFIKWSKDPRLYETLLEDGAALIGIGIATAGTIANAWVGWLAADGIASIAIGTLLIADGFVILIATRSLITGEAVAPPLMRDLRLALEHGGFAHRVTRLQTLHLGPSCILIAVNLECEKGSTSDADLQAKIDARLRATDDRVVEVMFRYSRHNRPLRN